MEGKREGGREGRQEGGGKRQRRGGAKTQREGEWKEWAGGGGETSSDNCVWVQANMRQLPVRPGSLACSGCKAGRLVTVPFSSQDAEGQGRR